MYELKWNEVLADLIGLMWGDQCEFERDANRVSETFQPRQQGGANLSQKSKCEVRVGFGKLTVKLSPFRVRLHSVETLRPHFPLRARPSGQKQCSCSSISMASLEILSDHSTELLLLFPMCGLHSHPTSSVRDTYLNLPPLNLPSPDAE